MPDSDRALRDVLATYPTGVMIVTGLVDGEPHGMACNSFSSVSLHPPLVAFCPSLASTTWPILRSARSLCFNVLGAGEADLSRRFAQRGARRFDGVAWHTSVEDAPRLDDAVAWLVCRVTRTVEAGDHELVLCALLAAEINGGDPLVFFGGRYGTFAEQTA